MLKSFGLIALVGLLGASAARADHLILPMNVLTSLPSCGGTVQTNQNGEQINLVFRNVDQCSNFDIVAVGFGILDVNYRNHKISESSSGTRSGSFTIPQVYIGRGLNGVRVEVKSNSGKHSDTIDLVFVSKPSKPGHPGNPGHGHGSLRGRCSDPDYTNFKAAKSFAYSPSGLNYSDSQATNWAMDYNGTHRCGTLEEFRARFVELQSYAYSPSFMNQSSDQARAFALENAETLTVREVQSWKANFKDAHELFYSPSYLNMDSSRASKRSDEWVRRFCDEGRELADLKAEFRKHYQFAYSPSGLNLSSQQAIAFALKKISYQTQCSDLLQ